MKKLLLGCFVALLLLTTNNASAQDLLAFNDTPTLVGFSESSTSPSPNFDLRRRYGRSRNRGNRHAFGIQLPYNFLKFGAGVNYTYRFTDILRFYVGMDYFFYAVPGRQFNTITNAGKKGSSFWGSHWDFKPNLNFVFGDGDFHFVLIAGVYFSYGYNVLQSALEEGGDILSGDYDDVAYQYIDGIKYYNLDKMAPGVGIGLDLGCGVEYQINDEFRISLDQELSVGLMTHWMMHLGAAYCF